MIIKLYNIRVYFGYCSREVRETMGRSVVRVM